MVERAIETMNGWPPELLWLGMLLLCYAGVLVFLKLFGRAGLYVYIGIGIVGANIQVLKVVQFGVLPEPIALGTVWFSSLYLATDILAERRGAKAARKAILLGFFAYLFFTIAMVITAGFANPAPPENGVDWPYQSHNHIVGLFAVQPGIFLAGVIAYLVSMSLNVFVFDRVRRATGGKHLWLRNNVSTIVAAIVDSTVFSFLAWIVFASEPLAVKTVLVTYIGGSLLIRFFVAFLDTPFMYLSRRVAPHE